VTRSAMHCATLNAVVLLSLGALAFAQPPLPPVDDAARQRDFLEFRGRLLEAVGRRDTRYVVAIADEGIVASFGGDEGRDAFVAHWDLNGTNTRFWNVMETVLNMGGTFLSDDIFAAPYVYSTWPEAVDPFTHSAVVGPHVRVREAPSLESPIVASVSYAIVGTASDVWSDDGWVAVVLRDGRRGYISGRYVRNALDYRAVFQRKDGHWLLTAFIAGD
jgi:hypothetical protein